jgi:hypothetical protein
MKPVGKIALAIFVVALVGAVLGGEMPLHDRADRAAAAGRTEQIASQVSPRDLREFDSGDGRAGGPVASAPVRAAEPAGRVAAGSAWRAS